MLSISAEIKHCLCSNSKPFVILTIGNSFRSDDGVGPYIGSKIFSKGSRFVVNAEYSPERIIDEVIAHKPKSILVIDAANFEGFPGEVRIIDKKFIPQQSLSTHSISMSVIAEILVKDTKAELKFLGIQPKVIRLGEGLSEEIKEVADEIISVINENYT